MRRVASVAHRARHARSIAMIVVVRAMANVVVHPRPTAASAIVCLPTVRARTRRAATAGHRAIVAKAAPMASTAANHSLTARRVVIVRRTHVTDRPATANAVVLREAANAVVLREMANAVVRRVMVAATITATAHRVAMLREAIVAATVAVRPSAAMDRRVISSVLSGRMIAGRSVRASLKGTVERGGNLFARR